MFINEILSSKPHNKHYLNRYIKFIESRQNKISDEIGEIHHICPKAKDLFPEYSSFTSNPWNKIKLSLKEHFIAHLLLYKTYGKSQAKAFHLMCNRTGSKNSKMYKTARQFQIEEFSKCNKRRLQDKSHNFLTNNPSKRSVHHRTGSKHKLESRNKTSKTIQSKPKLTCPYCQKEGQYNLMFRWHFNNCKFKT